MLDVIWTDLVESADLEVRIALNPTTKAGQQLVLRTGMPVLAVRAQYGCANPMMPFKKFRKFRSGNSRLRFAGRVFQGSF